VFPSACLSRDSEGWGNSHSYASNIRVREELTSLDIPDLYRPIILHRRSITIDLDAETRLAVVLGDVAAHLGRGRRGPCKSRPGGGLERFRLDSTRFERTKGRLSIYSQTLLTILYFTVRRKKSILSEIYLATMAAHQNGAPRTRVFRALPPVISPACAAIPYTTWPLQLGRCCLSANMQNLPLKRPHRRTLPSFVPGNRQVRQGQVEEGW